MADHLPEMSSPMSDETKALMDKYGHAFIQRKETGDMGPIDRTPEQVLAMTLKQLYPWNPDIVFGREARTIIEAFTEAGFVVVPRRLIDALVDEAIAEWIRSQRRTDG
jgi:hypothetical protein